MITTINGQAFAEMVFCAAAALNENRQTINELNVFPVPDGDTGTNMSMTMATAATALQSNAPTSIGEAADIAASALLRGARGNSGVILSLLFRGIARGLKGCDEANAADWARAMTEGVDAAYKAVMKPAEGTILTVSRRAAETAVDLVKAGTDDFILLLQGAIGVARIALNETQEQNPTLKKAGVIDAGGMGYLVILKAMLSSLRGEKAASSANITDDADDSVFSAFSTEEITFAFDTVFIVRKNDPDLNLEPLRAYLSSIGDSLVIGEDDTSFKVHVHTNTPGDALNRAQDYGTLELAKIENMRIQHEDLLAGRKAHSTDDLDDDKTPEPPEEPPFAAPEKPVGFVTVCAGDGLENLFLSLGADRVVTGGQTMNPSTEDILREVNRTPAETVFVFPNNKNIVMAAEQCVPLTEKIVRVIPTTSVPQGISAMAMMDPEAEPDDMDAAFRETASMVRTVSVTYAARDSEFDGYSIHTGEFLALRDGSLLGSFPGLEALYAGIGSAIAELEPEFLTVYYGEDVTEEEANLAAGVLMEACPDAEVSVVYGGQPVYYYMISVE